MLSYETMLAQDAGENQSTCSPLQYVVCCTIHWKSSSVGGAEYSICSTLDTFLFYIISRGFEIFMNYTKFHVV